MQNKKFQKILIVFFIIMAILPASFNGLRFFSKEYVENNNYPDISKRLYKHVYHLTKNIGDIDTRHPEKMQEAADYIANEFYSYGYEVKRQEYEVDGVVVENIIARKNWEDNREFIVLGAHYDTKDNPGADDNASGLSGLLELARILFEEDLSIPIEFVAFTNEEPPYFHTSNMGSRIYVKKLKEGGRSVKMAVILEMIGYYKDGYYSQEYPGLFGFFFPNKGNFIAIVGNKKSSDMVKYIKKTILETVAIPTEQISFDFTAGFLDYSDHGSFWRSDMKAVMITDTSFFRNPNYHKQTDTYDTLDYNRMSELIMGLKNVLTSDFRY